MEHRERKTGVLLHITSLPSQYGVGDLGDEAYKFVDSISEKGISLWQILPTGPTGFGDSPYAARSAFAGNELFISPKALFLKGWLYVEDVLVKAKESDRVDYGEARKLKMPLLFKAAANFLSSADKEDMDDFLAFRKEEGWWLEDYALFQALCAKYNDSRWFSEWPKDLRTREKKAVDKAKKEQKSLIDIYCVLQYFFFSQWDKLKSYANEKGVEIAGSISQSGAYGPQGAMHWFAEPLYGYYYANDSWVHRKHMELLANANVDFLYFDVTNGYYYLNNALSVMKICHELNEQGYDAPQVVFYTHSSSGNVVRGLYNDIYSKGLYEDTWI